MNESVSFAASSWRKSSTSDSGGCVEVAISADGMVGVRDTKASGRGPVLVFTEHEWTAFLEGARGGEFEPARLRGPS